MKIKTTSGKEYYIHNFSKIKKPKKVIELDCSSNLLTSLEPLSNLTNLQKLNCSYNRLTSLEPLSNLTNLQYLG